MSIPGNTHKLSIFSRLFQCKSSILGYPSFIHILISPGSVLPPVNNSVNGLLVQIHVEVLALPFVDIVSVILCIVCLAPAYLSCSSCFGFRSGRAV